jgi:hypothetical protein
MKPGDAISVQLVGDPTTERPRAPAVVASRQPPASGYLKNEPQCLVGFRIGDGSQPLVRHQIGLKSLEGVGVDPPYPRQGPYPREDVFRYRVALQMLFKSLEPGAWGQDYQQFSTIRQLR